MSKLKMLAVGIFATSLWPGTEVFDKSENGELVREGVFQVGEDEYETDADGKIVDTDSANNAKKADEQEAAGGFVNPFAPGVSYKFFLEAIPDGTSVEDYCRGNITEEEIGVLVADLKHYKK